MDDRGTLRPKGPMITSRDNDTFKELKKLMASSRERRRRGLVAVEGVRLVGICREHVGEAEIVAVRASAREEERLSGLLDPGWSRRRVILADPLFREAGTMESPSTVMAIVPRPRGRPRPGDDALLVEGIQDPGNLGTMFRSAAAAGVAVAYLSDTCADAWSPKCLRAGMGAQFRMEISEGADLVQVCRAFDGTVVALVPGSSRSLYDVDFTGAMALAVGSEGGGLSAPVKEKAAVRAGIPMPGWEESLNAASALTIALFEMVRQRGEEGKVH